MNRQKALLIVWVLALMAVVGDANVCHAMKRHPAGSDKTTGYWCFDCHDFRKDGNYKWIRPEISRKDSQIVLVGFTEGVYFKDVPPYDGICQVCHTTTAHYRSDGTGIDDNLDGTNDHFGSQNCLTCHGHFQQSMFSPSLVGSQSHDTHLINAVTSLQDPKGPGLAECKECHYEVTPGAIDYSRFADGLTFAETSACNRCHSPDGALDGVDDPAVGAKPNWVDGIYKATGKTLKDGKEDWCGTCHDAGICVIAGIQAPNVMGVSDSYGYKESGHGRFSVQCDACHDLGVSHTDGLARTYRATSDRPRRSYVKGYRLNNAMAVPRNGESAPAPEAFALCTNADCHAYAEVTGVATTGFRKDGAADSLHKYHLENLPTGVAFWDSDANYDTSLFGPIYENQKGADSDISCTACHNVHGSPSPAMVRHGELIGRVPAFDFRWYKADGVTETTDRSQSRSGEIKCANMPDLSANGVCYGCHTTYSTALRYSRTLLGVSTVNVTGVRVMDSAGVEKDAFSPGEGVRYEATFEIVGSDSFFVQSPPMQSHAYNTTTGAVEWLTKLGKKEEGLPAGTYVWTWDKTIPPEATTGTEAAVEIKIRIYDFLGGQLLDQNKKSKPFTIVAPAP